MFAEINKSAIKAGKARGWCLLVLTTALFALLSADAGAFTLDVAGCDANNQCNTPVSGFKWLLEEDNTNQSQPGVRTGSSIGLDIHNSYAPVVSKGSSATSTADIDVPEPGKRYFISVLPDSGYAMSGMSFDGGQNSVTVKVHQFPIPTAQISVLVFQDHNPINNVPDMGEAGLADFSVILFDLGGQMSQDVFGNPLGTTYDALGNVLVLGNGEIITDADGKALIKTLAPGKYGIRVIPKHSDTGWVQTATIEGTPGIDAWVKANEPSSFVEGFGTGFYHAFFGFANPNLLPWKVTPPVGGITLRGRNVFNHFGRPPFNQAFVPGAPVSDCWIGLNDLAAKAGLIAVPCDGDSNFTIPNVLPGTYQLVTWDKPLDALFGFNTVTVPLGSGDIELGNVLSFRWFGTFEGSVFYDLNQNGFRDPGETGIMEQVVNIRFRDGSLYQTQPTDVLGEYSLSEVFPFFKWLVVEVDFARYKPTGMTAVIDHGGTVPSDAGWAMPSFGKLNPQPQKEFNPYTGNYLARTEEGEVLTQAMHVFLNQTNVIDWGKIEYATGENGGISGIVYYDVTRAEDDPAFNAPEPWQPGIPGVQINLYEDFDADGIPDGPPVDTVYTDSWDENKPTGCIQLLPPIPGVKPCFDNYSTWNQVRPGVFDGGYAFGPDLPEGTYIVEAVPPTGYEIVKEEDKNVDFGSENVVSKLLLPPVCVGDLHVVPSELVLFPGVPAFYAGQTRPLCNRKQMLVSNGKNAAVDFYLFTEVPKAARVVGFVNNDVGAEFSAGSPVYGEKASPAWLPVSFRDWQDNEVARVYTDEYGSYNALLPSSFSMNIPAPSGVSPNMLTAVLNHPFLPDGSIDPFYDPSFSVTPWTLDYWPGKTTYLDTPIVPVVAFAGFPKNGPDVEQEDGTPLISEVSSASGGPVVCATPETITITSSGKIKVPNPDFQPLIPDSPALLTRDYGFGLTQGKVTLGGANLPVTGWTDETITVNVPASAATGQLLVVRGDNLKTSPTGITLHVSANACANVRHVTPGAGTPIQDAIDAALPGDLIVVGPGNYRENIFLYKPLKLQGSGSGSTVIFANPNPSDRLAAWHARALSLLGSDPFAANEAPGIMVLGNVAGFPFAQADEALIDGFKIFGAISGGGVYVYRDVNGLKISNNRISGNQGTLGGGVTIGIPTTAINNNPNITVSFNLIVKNGGVQGGGGVVVYPGSDNYVIQNNFIGGNFSRFNGGGIDHAGLSNNGLISNNKIVFNEVAFGGNAFGDGAGIFIGGDVTLLGLTEGAGTVKIDSNLIQGNLAGVGSGGGIRALFVNGSDVETNPLDKAQWHALTITNNMLVNNVAGFTGGGIALQDAANVNISNNTIANNDSTSTAANAFPVGSAASVPHGAGLVSAAHSTGLAAVSGQTFSNPTIVNNIIFNNHSYHTTHGGIGGLTPDPVWDLQVYGTAGYMSPKNSILTSLTPADGGNYAEGTNFAVSPKFVQEYSNSIFSAMVADEGGNAITVRFVPLKIQAGNYHLQANSPAKNNGSASDMAYDYEGDARTSGGGVDIGADEYLAKTVLADALTVIGPGEGAQIAQGSVLVIQLGAPANPAGVAKAAVSVPATSYKLEYSVNNGKAWKLIAKDVTGTSYEWTVPSFLKNLNKVRIRTTGYDARGRKVSADTTDKNFSLVVVRLTSLNGLEILKAGAQANITWETYATQRPVAKAVLSYSVNGGTKWTKVAALSDNPGTYAWTVPGATKIMRKCKVKLTLLDDKNRNIGEDVSEGTFTVQP